MARAALPGLEHSLPRLSRAADHSVLWFAAAAGLAVTRSVRLRRAALRGVVAIGIASPLANVVGKGAFRRVRPRVDLVPPIRIRWRLPDSPAFPSGHTASAAAFATGVALEAPAAIAAPVTAIAATVGFSRVYTGAHYPGDVLAGAALGVLAGVCTRAIWPVRGRAAAGLRSARSEARASTRSEERASTRSEERASTRSEERAGTGLIAVVNVRAGGAVSVADLLRRELPGAEVLEVGGAPATGDNDLADVLEDAASRAEVLAVAGGDGTVNAGALAAMRHDVPLLPVPDGTFDRFAREIGLASPADAIAAYRSGRVGRADAGTAGDRVFLNVAGLGAYTVLVDERDRLERRIGKWPALAVASLRVLRRGGPASLVIDGRRYDVWLGFVGNCRYASRGVAPTWRNRLDDGLLDVRLITGHRRATAVAALLTGHLRIVPGYHAWRAREVRIDGPRGEIRLATDGETGTLGLPAVLGKRPAGLGVFHGGSTAPRRLRGASPPISR